MKIALEPHPDLDARAFVTRFPRPLGALDFYLSLLARLDAQVEPLAIG